MHETVIITKDNREFIGSIWELNYQEYFIRLVGTDKDIKFSEIKSAVTKNQRISVREIGDEDILGKIRYELQRFYHKSEEEIREILEEI